MSGGWYRHRVLAESCGHQWDVESGQTREQYHGRTRCPHCGVIKRVRVRGTVTLVEPAFEKHVEPERPMCAWPKGCITRLNSDTIAKGWDMCATHREMQRAEALDVQRERASWWDQPAMQEAARWVQSQADGPIMTATIYRKKAPRDCTSLHVLVARFGSWPAARRELLNYGQKGTTYVPAHKMTAERRRAFELIADLCKQHGYATRKAYREARAQLSEPCVGVSQLVKDHGSWSMVVTAALDARPRARTAA